MTLWMKWKEDSPLSSITIPKNVQEALDHPGWQQAMIVEMQALENNGTWELVSLPPGKKTVGCWWVYVVKVRPNGEVDWLKARLVAKGYTQIYGLHYCDTFSPLARITIVQLFLAMAAIRHWPLYQLDIKKCLSPWWFRGGNLYEATSWFCCLGGV